jgi:hypothetical protein
MTFPSTRRSSDDRHARIIAIVADYLGRLAGGATVSAADIEQAHADLMPELAESLAQAMKPAELARSAETQVQQDPHKAETIEKIELDVTHRSIPLSPFRPYNLAFDNLNVGMSFCCEIRKRCHAPVSFNSSLWAWKARFFRFCGSVVAPDRSSSTSTNRTRKEIHATNLSRAADVSLPVHSRFLWRKGPNGRTFREFGA